MRFGRHSEGSVYPQTIIRITGDDAAEVARVLQTQLRRGPRPGDLETRPSSSPAVDEDRRTWRNDRRSYRVDPQGNDVEGGHYFSVSFRVAPATFRRGSEHLASLLLGELQDAAERADRHTGGGIGSRISLVGEVTIAPTPPPRLTPHMEQPLWRAPADAATETTNRAGVMGRHPSRPPGTATETTARR